MKPFELPGARRLYRLANRALAQIRELWHYAGEDEPPPDSQVEALRILRIDVPLSAKRQFQLFCSEHFPGLADILDCLATDQLWALLSMRVQLANNDQLQASQSAAVRFGGLGRRYVLVAFDDRPAHSVFSTRCVYLFLAARYFQVRTITLCRSRDGAAPRRKPTNSYPGGRLSLVASA